jgi:hypothetical protein
MLFGMSRSASKPKGPVLKNRRLPGAYQARWPDIRTVRRLLVKKRVPIRSAFHPAVDLFPKLGRGGNGSGNILSWSDLVRELLDRTVADATAGALIEPQRVFVRD